MLLSQQEYNNAKNTESEKKEKSIYNMSLNNFVDFHKAINYKDSPFYLFIYRELNHYHKNLIPTTYPSDNGIIYYFYERLRKRIYDKDSSKFSILSTDNFIEKYAPDIENSVSDFYLTKNKEAIITAIIDQVFYGILRNKYIHWSSDMEKTWGQTPNEPYRKTSLEDFDYKRPTYN